MKAVIQRVLNAKVTINGCINRRIDKGVVVLLCIMKGDSKAQADFLVQKISKLRIFCDQNGKQNLSLHDIKGDALIVSNFTLSADCKKGTRPSYDNAQTPNLAKSLYDYFIQQIKKENINNVQTGEFGADMQLNLTNDGPVTIVIDTKAIGK